MTDAKVLCFVKKQLSYIFDAKKSSHWTRMSQKCANVLYLQSPDSDENYIWLQDSPVVYRVIPPHLKGVCTLPCEIPGTFLIQWSIARFPMPSSKRETECHWEKTISSVMAVVTVLCKNEICFVTFINILAHNYPDADLLQFHRIALHFASEEQL